MKFNVSVFGEKSDFILLKKTKEEIFFLICIGQTLRKHINFHKNALVYFVTDRQTGR